MPAYSKSAAYLFGEKLAETLPETLRLPDPNAHLDPLGVGPDAGNLTTGLGRAHLLMPARSNQLQRKLRPKQLQIQPNKPMRVVDPNKQTT